MSSLTLFEKRSLEKLFDMSSGYVLNFSDRTFEEFFVETVSIDIHSEKYQGSGTSKAKKLREFWRIEPDHLAGKVVLALIEDARSEYTRLSELGLEGEDLAKRCPASNRALIDQCKEIGNRLLAGNVNLNPLKKTTSGFDAKHLAEQIRRMEQSVNSDPSLAIGTSKELIETCCKTILAERGKPYSGTPDIPVLTKATLKELNLIPDGISESTRGNDIIRRLLQNLGTIGNNLAELRGLYGTGHGKHGKAEGLTPRHAKLAVGAASTLATFLFDTHNETMS
ncbi:MAG: abortive infection family protein [bacterium]